MKIRSTYLLFALLLGGIISSTEIKGNTNHEAFANKTLYTCTSIPASIHQVQVPSGSNPAQLSWIGPFSSHNVSAVSGRLNHPLQKLGQSPLLFFGLEYTEVTFYKLLTLAAAVAIVLLMIGHRWQETAQRRKLEKRIAENEELRSKLHSKEGDLNELTAHMTMLRQFSNQTKLKMKELEDLEPAEQKKQMDALCKSFGRKVNDYKMWEIIHSNMDEVNSAFFKEIDRACGGKLTKKEKELCALFRLNISDGHIAEMRGIGDNAVRVARHRIKKKLNLEKGECLDYFLSNLEENKSGGIESDVIAKKSSLNE